MKRRNTKTKDVPSEEENSPLPAASTVSIYFLFLPRGVGCGFYNTLNGYGVVYDKDNKIIDKGIWEEYE